MLVLVEDKEKENRERSEMSDKKGAKVTSPTYSVVN